MCVYGLKTVVNQFSGFWVLKLISLILESSFSHCYLKNFIFLTSVCGNLQYTPHFFSSQLSHVGVHLDLKGDGGSVEYFHCLP